MYITQVTLICFPSRNKRRKRKLVGVRKRNGASHDRLRVHQRRGEKIKKKKIGGVPDLGIV